MARAVANLPMVPALGIDEEARLLERMRANAGACDRRTQRARRADSKSYRSNRAFTSFKRLLEEVADGYPLVATLSTSVTAQLWLCIGAQPETHRAYNDPQQMA
jgi:hypothetical protein